MNSKALSSLKNAEIKPDSYLGVLVNKKTEIAVLMEFLDDESRGWSRKRWEG
jgi:hypothetical protein